MYDSTTSLSRVPDIPNPYSRADALEREITDLCAQINAASYRLLQLVAELDDEAPWGAWGLQSCAHWLNWRCGIGMNAAREKVRVVLQALNAAMDARSAEENKEVEPDDVTAKTLDGDEPGRCELDIGRKTRAAPPAMRRADRRQPHPIQPARWPRHRGTSSTTGHRQRRRLTAP